MAALSRFSNIVLLPSLNAEFRWWSLAMPGSIQTGHLIQRRASRVYKYPGQWRLFSTARFACVPASILTQSGHSSFRRVWWLVVSALPSYVRSDRQATNHQRGRGRVATREIFSQQEAVIEALRCARPMGFASCDIRQRRAASLSHEVCQAESDLHCLSWRSCFACR